VSQENVEIVRGLQPSPDVDLAQLFRDDAIWAATLEGVSNLIHPDFTCIQSWIGAEPTTYAGVNGLREAWLDWLTPWATYRTEIQDIIDCGERVLVLVLDFARREGTTDEIKLIGSAVWTVTDEKIAHVRFYPDRTEALRAVGLKE
jgi:ketosteroid isomerase-like protein